MSRGGRVALVRPPYVLPFSTVNTVRGTPPLGLAYLSGSLRAASWDVTVIDGFGEAPDAFSPVPDLPLFANGLTAEQIVERLPEDSGLIGVSCMFSNEWIYAKKVMRAIRRRFPRTPIVAGGEHITADPERALRTCEALDLAVLGEGEETLSELASCLAAGGPLDGVPGLARRAPVGRPARTRPRERLRAIDELPWPSWDGIPLETYLRRGLGHDVIRKRNMPILATRGCPYQCTFCSSPNMWGTRWVARDVEDVIREMKHDVRTYGADHFELYDLTAVVNRRWILDFCDRLILERLPATWALPSGTRSEALDGEVLERLRLSGCRAVTYAPESGSPSTLRRLKKRVDPGRMLVSMRRAVLSGLVVRANLIMGLPGQTTREALESVLFLAKMAWLGVHDAAVFPFVPYPGTELAAQLAAEGRLPSGDEDYELFLAANVYNEVGAIRSWSRHLSSRAVKLLCVGGMSGFYLLGFLLRPLRLATAAARFARRDPKTMFDRTLLALARNFLAGARRPQRLPA